MTQEEKELLLKDLSARVLYKVKVWHFGVTRELLGIIPSTENVMVGYDINDYEDSVIEDIKPYLRPMSSMTEEEKEKVCLISQDGNIEYHYGVFYRCQDYLNSIHVDYRGLIEKGLALEAPERMYDRI